MPSRRCPGGNLQYFFRMKAPKNPDTVAINIREIRRLFHGEAISFQSLILSPPLSRRIAQVCLPAVAILEWMAPFLRSHLMATIKINKVP